MYKTKTKQWERNNKKYFWRQNSRGIFIIESGLMASRHFHMHLFPRSSHHFHRKKRNKIKQEKEKSFAFPLKFVQISKFCPIRKPKEKQTKAGKVIWPPMFSFDDLGKEGETTWKHQTYQHQPFELIFASGWERARRRGEERDAEK